MQLSQNFWASCGAITAELSGSSCGERGYLTQKQSTSQMFFPKVTNQNENSIELEDVGLQSSGVHQK